MKTIFTTSVLVLAASLNIFAQTDLNEKPNKTQTNKGKWFVQSELGTVFSYEPAEPTTTMFNYSDSNNYAFGLSGGYFLKKDLALMASFGYSKFNNGSNSINYRIGLKKYFKSNIFISGDIGAYHIDLVNPFLATNQKTDVFTTGLNFGYAWFIGNFLSVEPSLRMDADFGASRPDFDLINLNIGFSEHF